MSHSVYEPVTVNLSQTVSHVSPRPAPWRGSCEQSAAGHTSGSHSNNQGHVFFHLLEKWAAAARGSIKQLQHGKRLCSDMWDEDHL